MMFGHAILLRYAKQQCNNALVFDMIGNISLKDMKQKQFMLKIRHRDI